MVSIADQVRVDSGLLVADRTGGELAWTLAAIHTTALVSSRATDAVARASRRYVHGEFRLVEFAGPNRKRS